MDELDVIRFSGLRNGPDPSAEAWRTARLAIDRELAKSGRGLAVRRAGAWFGRHGKSSSLVLTAAAVTAVVVLTTGAVTPGRDASAAAGTLNRLAAVANGTSALQPSPADYLYTDEISRSVGGYSDNVNASSLSGPPEQNYYAAEQEVQRWVNAAGHGREVMGEQMNSAFLTPVDSSRRVPTIFRPSDEPYQSAQYPLSYPNNLALSSSTQSSSTLAVAIGKAIGWGPSPAPAQLFGAVQSGLMVGQSGAFRAAVFKMISMLPGVTTLGTVTDDLGRSGVGFGMPLPNALMTGEQEQLIFDPTTSALLEFRVVQVSPNTGFGSYCHTNGTISTAHPIADPCPSTSLPPASRPNPPLGSVLRAVEFVSVELATTTTATPSGQSVPYCDFGGPISRQELCEPLAAR